MEIDSLIEVLTTIRDSYPNKTKIITMGELHLESREVSPKLSPELQELIAKTQWAQIEMGAIGWTIRPY